MKSEQRGAALLAAGIFLLALLTFLPALWNDFVNLDDSLYVYDNALVKGGLAPAGIARAFAGPACNFYHPLTMLSLMLDHQLWGLNPFGFHLTNVVVHAASSALLFLALAAMTGARWRSAFVAAVFAIHPLRVESVAWVAERKDVLSVFFFMLTLAAYAWYVRRPGAGRYAAVLAAFLAGLLCKTTLVTLPAVLLLLDTWPLRRFVIGAPDGRAVLMRLVVEKLPLFALAIAASAIAVYAQKAGVISYGDFPLPSRVQNAVLSYFAYMAQTLVPAGLSPFYPFLESSFALWRVIPAALGLAGLTAWAIAWHRRAPYFLVGWLWYLGVLVPMIGLVQVGAFARADRFTYLPQIGLLIALTWGACEVTRRWKFQPVFLAAASAIVLVACAAITVRQIGFWSDGETLFRHALAVTSDNGVAHESLAAALLERRKAGVIVPQAVSEERGAEAIAHFREAARLLPGHADVHLNLGIALFATKHRDEAAGHLRTALGTMTFHANGHFLLGLILLDKGELDEGMGHLEKSLELDSHNAVARINLASIYRRQGRLGDAIAQYRAAIRQDPDYSDAHNNLGIALHEAGFRDEAVREFHEAVRCDPANASARRNLDAASQ